MAGCSRPSSVRAKVLVNLFAGNAHRKSTSISVVAINEITIWGGHLNWASRLKLWRDLNYSRQVSSAARRCWSQSSTAMDDGLATWTQGLVRRTTISLFEYSGEMRFRPDLIDWRESRTKYRRDYFQKFWKIYESLGQAKIFPSFCFNFAFDSHGIRYI